MFYSPGLGGFYSERVHGDNIPMDAVEISLELHAELLRQITAGKRIVPGAGGLPRAAEQELPTEIQTAERERTWRDAQLLRCGGIRDRHRDEIELGLPTTLTDSQYSELMSYLQQLRDWPAAMQFPDSSQRPVPPDWILSQTQ